MRNVKNHYALECGCFDGVSLDVRPPLPSFDTYFYYPIDYKENRGAELEIDRNKTPLEMVASPSPGVNHRGTFD